MNHIHLIETTTTMQAVRNIERLDEVGVVVVSADFQTSGRGQRGNSWEAERGQNLLFSVAFRPEGVLPSQQFVVSEALSLSIVAAIRKIIPSLPVSVKWPNDIYIADDKVAGILIEHDLQGGDIVRTVAGVGLNVNQMVFCSGAPNPVSLRQIVGRDLNRVELLEDILEEFFWLMGLEGKKPCTSWSDIHNAYMNVLYRREGYHSYRSENEEFVAKIVDVSPCGILSLFTSEGEVRSFSFKEVEFVLHTPKEP